MCGEQRCPAIDFAGNPGFFTTPSGLDGVRPLTTNDRLDHCLCALTDNGYNSGDFAASSKMCPTKEEKEKQDCLTNPFDEIDRPKPECVRYLYPTNIDMSAWYARMCERVRPNCDNDYITLDGRCGCNNDPLPAGDRTALCPNRNVTDCGPDATLDMKTCSCQSFDGGDVVWGGTGGCSVLPETFPGGIDRWQLTERVWADQMTLAGTPSTVLRAQAGGTTLVAPAVRMADFERDIGNALNVTMLAPDALLRSDFPGETNVHATIPGLNLFNEFMGQVVDRNLTRDVPTTTAVSLSSRFRTAFQLARDNDLECPALVLREHLVTQSGGGRIDGHRAVRRLAFRLSARALRGDAGSHSARARPDLPRARHQAVATELGRRAAQSPAHRVAVGHGSERHPWGWRRRYRRVAAGAPSGPLDLRVTQSRRFDNPCRFPLNLAGNVEPHE